MNTNSIVWYYKIGGTFFREESLFCDIYNFQCTNAWGKNKYFLEVYRLSSDGTEKVSFIVGHTDQDYIMYKGKKYTVKDFPQLVIEIYNRNLEKTLEVL